MTYIPTGECEIWFSFLVAGDNEPMYSHLGYLTTATPTQAQVDAGFAEFQLQFKVLWNGDMSLTGGHVIVGPSTASSRWDSSITAVVGTGVATLLPNNCAMLARKTTALGGRRGRGRMFFPCPTETGVSAAGVVSGATITAWNAELDTLKVGGSVHTAFAFLGEPRLFHTGTDANPDPSSTPITDLGCQNKIGTQRRRMRR